MWMLPVGMRAQVFINELHLPAELCSDVDLTVSFGRSNMRNVVVGHQEASLGHSDRIFLPDGVMCDGSCSYRSPVTFSIFSPDAVITSMEDIKYVRIKMEHSYIGDIYMGITCPNGQHANLMRFAGSGTSSCDNVIPQSARQWLQGNNMEQDTYFGQANDNENSEYPCIETAAGNEPGVGWNYCWSNNSTSGYQYASDDGIVYRYGHSHNGSVDSSNVAAHTNFYHPDQSFSNLIGCPLNGQWFIEVVDGFSIDNGYIFEWELSLDATLIPNQCLPAAYAVEGGGAVRVNDSVFTLPAPQGLQTDSAIGYRFLIVTTCGDTIDTTATIVFHPTRETSDHDTVCEGTSYIAAPYVIDSTGSYDLHLRTVHTCDSLVHLDLAHWPSYDIHIPDTTCRGVPLKFEDTAYTETGTYTHRFATAEHCDSLRTLHLTVMGEELRARIQAVPLIVDAGQHDIELRDQSINHVGSRWLIGGGSYAEPRMTLAYPIELDSLEISLEAVSREGCRDTATVVARYDRSAVFIPNVFTPVIDGNNRWRPAVNDLVELEVWIYNRQGVLVGHLEGMDDEWDGGGQPQGTYVYTMRYRTRVRPEWRQERTGTITLLR